MADAAHAKPHHDYHLVNPSPWPASARAGVPDGRRRHPVDAPSAAYAPIIFGLGVIGIAYTMFSWWRDVIYEAEVEHDHTRVVQISHRYGMILFIASEVMFFVAWFWAYFNTALFPDQFRTSPDRVHRRGVAAQGHRDLRSLALPAAQYADPAHVGHHGDLGASRAAWRTTARV